jgi:hypothetical protein
MIPNTLKEPPKDWKIYEYVPQFKNEMVFRVRVQNYQYKNCDVFQYFRSKISKIQFVQ